MTFRLYAKKNPSLDLVPEKDILFYKVNQEGLFLFLFFPEELFFLGFLNH